jgi:hypothetical protein
MTRQQLDHHALTSGIEMLYQEESNSGLAGESAEQGAEGFEAAG